MIRRGRKALCDICGTECLASELRPIEQIPGQPTGTLACRKCFELPNPQLAPFTKVLDDPRPPRGPQRPAEPRLVPVGQQFDEWWDERFGVTPVVSPPPPPPPPSVVTGTWTTDDDEEWTTETPTEMWEYEFIEGGTSPPPPPPPPSPYNYGLSIGDESYLLVAPGTALSWGGNEPDHSTPPVAVDDTASTDYNTPVAIDVLANDSDPKGGPLFLYGFADTVTGEIDDDVDQLESEFGTLSKFGELIVYTPNDGFYGDDTFTYGVQDAAGNVSYADVTVTVAQLTVDDPPVAAFSGSPLSGVLPLTVTFDNTTTGDPESFAWTFGDGGTSTQEAPTYTYTTAGTYTVSLVATNSAGSDTETKTSYITVTASSSVPVANFSATPRTSTLTPMTVQFSDLSTGTPTSWLWQFGDGTTSTLKNPSKTYVNIGSYNVTLSATNASGTGTKTEFGFITVGVPAPVVDFVASPLTGVAPKTITFTDLSTNSPTAWSWNFGDGQFSSAKNPTHTYQSGGDYDVKLTASNTTGSGTKTRLAYISISDPPAVTPVADFTATTPISGAAPLTVQFSNLSTNTPTAYEWTFGDGTTSTLKNPSKTYANAGSYTVTLKATNAAGSDTETKTGYITVTAGTFAAEFSGSPTSGNVPLIVQFTDSSSGSPTAWSWDFGDGTASTAQNPTKTYTAAGSYTVKLTASKVGATSTKTRTGYITAGTTGTNTLFGLPILMKSDFSGKSGKTWRDNATEIKGCFKSQVTGVPIEMFSNPSKESLADAHVDLASPASGEPVSFRIKYTKNRDTNSSTSGFQGNTGGGCDMGVRVGYTGAAGTTTGYKKAAVEVYAWFPSNFTNFWDPQGYNGNPTPFKFLGLAGGVSNGTANFWSDGQGVGPEPGFYWPEDSIHKDAYRRKYGREMPTGPAGDKGFSYRWQGTNRFDQNTGTIKPLPSITDNNADKTTNTNFDTATHYGRWQPAFNRQTLTKGRWHKIQWYFEGNTKGRHDGTIRMLINDNVVWERVGNVQHRGNYDTKAHSIWILTFFGGVPTSNLESGSPQDQYVYLRDFTFAGSN